MHDELNLALIPPLPQAEFLQQLLPALWQRAEVQALWLEGSMGRGNADLYSDVDLYVAVAAEALDDWRSLAIAELFGERYLAHSFSTFGAELFVYHVYLTAGGIYDLHIQPQTRTLPKSQRLLLACRDEAYAATILAAQSDETSETIFAPQPIDPTIIEPLLVFFWINADKSRKVLYRNQDFTGFAGLYLYRMMLARLLFMEATGNDCGDLLRVTIHGLKAVARVLNPTLHAKIGSLMGAPATNRREMIEAQNRLYEEVGRVGRVLAERYPFIYPVALEQAILQNWQRFIELMVTNETSKIEQVSSNL